MSNKPLQLVIWFRALLKGIVYGIQPRRTELHLTRAFAFYGRFYCAPSNCDIPFPLDQIKLAN